jgi:hypothetical protein
MVTQTSSTMIIYLAKELNMIFFFVSSASVSHIAEFLSDFLYLAIASKLEVFIFS